MSGQRKHDVHLLLSGVAIMVIIVGLFMYLADSNQSNDEPETVSVNGAEIDVETEIIKEATSEADAAVEVDPVTDAAGSTVAEVDDVTGMTEALQLMEAEAYDEAVSVLLSFIENESENADAYAWLAACYGSLIDEVGIFQKLKYNNLMEENLEIAESLDPDSTIVHMVRGNRYLNAPDEFGGNVEKAIEDFTYCIENGRNDADIYFSLGQAYEKLGEPRMAVQAYENALKQNPKHVEARIQLTRLNA